MTTLVLISDTHGKHNELNLPEGDILVHAGDFTNQGAIHEISSFSDWLSNQPFKHKIVVAGNHEKTFESQPSLAKSILNSAIYLENSGVTLEGINFWGSPVTPKFFNWAFNKERGEQIKFYWDLIPENTHVLITHGPPHQILDLTFANVHAGCEELRKKVFELPNLKLNVFGHIHEGYGYSKMNNVSFINAANLDRKYKCVNRVQTFELH